MEDSGASVGKRYARTDEIGIPFGVTIDFDTVQNNSVTLRDRDSMAQVRIPVRENLCRGKSIIVKTLQIDEVAEVVWQLSTARLSWQQVAVKYPAFTEQENTAQK